MNIPSPVNYLCAVTELSVLIVTERKHERCVQIFYLLITLNPFMKSFTSSLSQTFSRPPAAWRKYIFFKVHVSPLYLFHLQSLVYYLKQSQRTLSLMNSTYCRGSEKNICTIYLIRLLRRCAIFCFAFEGKRIMRVCEGVDENLISQNGLT